MIRTIKKEVNGTGWRDKWLGKLVAVKKGQFLRKKIFLKEKQKSNRLAGPTTDRPNYLAVACDQNNWH